MHLEGFTAFSFQACGIERSVFVSGVAGPPLIVLHELPSISAELVALARFFIARGYRIYLPALRDGFDTPEAPGDRHAAFWDICIAREFVASLAGDTTRPIVGWIRGLTRRAHHECASARVGLLGMCFSGGFALAAAVEPAVSGAVCCGPALPIPPSDAVDISAADQALLAARLAHGDLRMRAYRFQGDASSPCARTQRMGRLLGPHFVARCLPDAAAQASARTQARTHNVLTHHFSEEPGSTTAAVRDEIADFFAWRLRGAAEPAFNIPELRDCRTRGCASQASPPFGG